MSFEVYFTVYRFWQEKRTRREDMIAKKRRSLFIMYRFELDEWYPHMSTKIAKIRKAATPFLPVVRFRPMVSNSLILMRYKCKDMHFLKLRKGEWPPLLRQPLSINQDVPRLYNQCPRLNYAEVVCCLPDTTQRTSTIFLYPL